MEGIAGLLNGQGLTIEPGDLSRKQRKFDE